MEKSNEHISRNVQIGNFKAHWIPVCLELGQTRISVKYMNLNNEGLFYGKSIKNLKNKFYAKDKRNFLGPFCHNFKSRKTSNKNKTILLFPIHWA